MIETERENRVPVEGPDPSQRHLSLKAEPADFLVKSPRDFSIDQRAQHGQSCP